MPGKSGGGESFDDLHAAITEAWERVREVQRRMPDKRENVYVVASLDLYPMVDPDSPFRFWRINGGFSPRIAEVALSEIYKVLGHATAIRLESIQDPGAAIARL